MTTYKELAERLEETMHDDAGFHLAVDEAIEILRSLDAQKPIGYWGGAFSIEGGADLYEVEQVSAFGRVYKNLPLYAAPVAAQPQDSEPLSDAEMPLTGGGNVYMSQFDFNVLQRRGRVTATLYNEPVGNAITEVRLIAHGIKERG